MLNVPMLSVAHKPFMLSFIMLTLTYKPFMLSVIILNVIMLSDKAPMGHMILKDI
jgi:hypothetical protein